MSVCGATCRPVRAIIVPDVHRGTSPVAHAVISLAYRDASRTRCVGRFTGTFPEGVIPARGRQAIELLPRSKGVNSLSWSDHNE